MMECKVQWKQPQITNGTSPYIACKRFADSLNNYEKALERELKAVREEKIKFALQLAGWEDKNETPS